MGASSRPLGLLAVQEFKDNLLDLGRKLLAFVHYAAHVGKRRAVQDRSNTGATRSVALRGIAVALVCHSRRGYAALLIGRSAWSVNDLSRTVILSR
jgi:hypothetical protein